jgi:tetratricopeptide (TPR) repeat protein
LLFILAGPFLAAAPRITFERRVPAPHDLGDVETIALVRAIGDTVKVDAFVERFIEQVNRGGQLRMRDARRGGDPKADAYLSVKSFTCESKKGTAEGNAYDVDGKKMRRQFVWSDAICTARVDVSAGKQQVSYLVKGEGTSPRGEELTDEEKNIALDQATRYAAVNAADRITPRRVRESIQLDANAPAFDEGYARIDVGELSDAREIWQKALRQDPRSAALHYNLAAVCEALGDHEAAELHYVTANRLAPREDRYAYEYKSFMRRRP